jgi:hypothetical protein
MKAPWGIKKTATKLNKIGRKRKKHDNAVRRNTMNNRQENLYIRL